MTPAGELLHEIFTECMAWADDCMKTGRQLGAVGTLAARVGLEMCKESEAPADPNDTEFRFLSLEDQRRIARLVLGEDR